MAAWDESLKAQGINPGTSADLTVATLCLAGLLGRTWHGT
jgi:triphosphoribosyl-dephospho-CoA synthase